MIQLLTLFIIIWFMIFSATRFLQYYRIVTEYKQMTKATVVKVSPHQKRNKKEKPAMDVLMSYDLNGEEGMSEVIVPSQMAEQYQPGSVFDICVKVSDNGAVHIASYSSANRKIMYGHLAAVLIELAAFVLIWLSIL